MGVWQSAPRPGSGKTRLAIEYVHRHGTTRFKGGLFWIDASKSDTGIEDQLYQIACVIDRADQRAITTPRFRT